MQLFVHAIQLCESGACNRTGYRKRRVAEWREGFGGVGAIMHVGKREKQSALLVIITAGSELACLPV